MNVEWDSAKAAETSRLMASHSGRCTHLDSRTVEAPDVQEDDGEGRILVSIP
jgi:hypothetical protein